MIKYGIPLYLIAKKSEKNVYIDIDTLTETKRWDKSTICKREDAEKILDSIPNADDYAITMVYICHPDIDESNGKAFEWNGE